MLANRARMMAALLAALIGTAGFFGCHEPQDFKEARAYRVKSRSQLIGGPKALGTKNDIIMENDKIRVLINAQPTSMAFTRYGGAILDADLNRYEEGFDPAAGGRDQFGELVPIFDIKGFGLETVPGSGPVVRAAADAVEIVDSGSDGGDAVVRVTGVLRDFLQPLKLIPMPLNGLPVKATTTYTLGTGDAFVKMETTFKVLNEDGSEPETETPIELRPVKAGEDPLTLMFTGDAVGDALFFGNSLSMFGPGVFGFSPEFYIQEEYLRGNSILSDPVLLDWVGGIGDGVGYGLYHPDGPLSFPLMENILTAAFEQVAAAGNVLPAPGSTYTYRRYFIVADGDASGLLDEVIGLSDAPSARLEGHVMYEGGGEPASGVHVHVFPHPTFSGSGEYVPVTGTYEETNEYLASRAVGSVSAHRLIPLTRFETDSRRDDSAADGSFSGKIPVDPETGELHAIVMASGPGNTRSKLYPVRLRVGKKERLAIVLPATGTIDYIIENYDQRGPALPAKLTAVSLSGHGLSDPFLGESFLPASEATISHSVDGRGTLTLPAGRYRLVASRGPEYSTDEAIVSVSPHKTEQVLLYIDRVVDTSGWISGDFHLHANRSTDSGADLPGRVLSFLVEGLEIVASSDHDYITNYRPYVEDFGARDLLYTMPGDELSHLSYGHFNGYPMRYDEREVAGGAPNWRTPSPSTNLPDGSPMPEWTPQDVFDALRERGDRSLVDQDPIVVANHMEESITGYFRAFGWLQYQGIFERPDIFTVGDPVVHDGQIFAKTGEANFSFDFDAVEVINSKRYADIRTATEEETRDSTFLQPAPAQTPILPVLVRTGDEQLRIETGDLLLDHTNRGQIDDYMTLLAQGRMVAGLGCSDSHDTKKIEAGKARTYVMSSTDDPRFLDVDEIITNMKAGRVIASTGPFVEAWVNDRPIGSRLHAGDGTLDVRIRAQAPPWMSLDRLEIYANGMLIGEIGEDASDHFLGCETDGLTIDGPDQVVRFNRPVSCHIARDAFINVVAIGYEGMGPVVNPIEGPSVEITDTLLLGVSDLLSKWLGLNIGNIIPVSGEFARNHEIYPYAFTNAIWVDVDGTDADGDGYDYDGPGYIPGWFDEDDAPAKSLEVLSSTTNQAAILAAKVRTRSLTSGLYMPTGSEAPPDFADDPADWDDDPFFFSCGS